MTSNLFRAVADIALGAKKRRDEEHSQFLSFYRELVETVPAEVATLFGTLNNIRVVSRDGSKSSCGIELTAADLLWWRNELLNKGVRFALSTDRIKAAMLTHVAKKAEASGLTADERKKLVALLLDEKS